MLPRFVLSPARFAALFLLLTGFVLHAQNAPFANTQSPTAITATNALLNGMASPNGTPSSAWFEWGEDRAYGNVTDAVDVGDGTGVVRVNAALEGLFRTQTIHYRLVVSNEFGVAMGFDQMFTTEGKAIAWGESTNGKNSVPSAASGAVSSSGGYQHGLALRSDSRIVSWGYFSSPSIPSNASNGVAVAAGGYFSVAIRTNGTVAAWGNNNIGQTNVPVGLSNVVAVAAGYEHGLALRDDGRVFAWGNNMNGRTNVPVDLSNVVSVSAGTQHSVALRDDGTVAAWGRAGRIEVPVGLSNVVSIAAGVDHTLALLRDGTVVAWGMNTSGQTSVPPDLTNVVAIAAGTSHSLALTDDGRLVGWGAGPFGITSIPSGVGKLLSIEAGNNFNTAIVDGRPYATSSNYIGAANHEIIVQFAGADPNGSPVSFRVKTLPQAGVLYQYTNGTRGALILDEDTLVSDSAARLIFVPDPDTVGDPYATFEFVSSSGGVESMLGTTTISIVGTPYTVTRPATLITSSNATLNAMVVGNGFPTMTWFEWGPNQNYGFETVPLPITGSPRLTNISYAITGLTVPQSVYFRSVASNVTGIIYGAPQKFGTGGKVVAWGRNNSGQTNILDGLTNVVTIAAGSYHNLVLQNDGKLRAWGSGVLNKTNIPVALNNVAVASITCGYENNVVLDASGKLTLWGLSVPGVSSSVLATLTNIVSAAANGDHLMVLRNTGTVGVWGGNSQGQTNVPPPVTNIVAVAMGMEFAVALRIDGTVHAWGRNEYGQTDVPAGLMDVVSISAAGRRTLALRKDGSVVGWGQNHVGQADPPAATNVLKLATGWGQNLALTTDGNLLVWAANDQGQGVLPAELSEIDAIAGGLDHNVIVAEARPVSRSATNTVLVNSDTTIQLVAADANKDPLQLQITSLPTAGALYQYTAGGRGAPIVTPNTLVSDPLGRVIFVPGQDEFSIGYAGFTFTADDGVQASNPGTVTLNVVLPSSPRFLSSTIGTNGNVEMIFQGQTNATYRVLGSTNLIEWEVLGNATTTSPGTFQFTHAGTTNSALMFYRATAP